MSPSRNTWITADPVEAAERLAIVETSAADFQANLHRPREPQPGPTMAELLKAGYRAAKAQDPEWTPDWPAWQRIMGATDGPVSRRSLSDNSKQSNPPPKGLGFLGAGRGGKWWAGRRAKLTRYDTKGEALAEVDRQADRGRREAARAALGLIGAAAGGLVEGLTAETAGGGLVEGEAMADADGRPVASARLGDWAPARGARGAKPWWKQRREAHRLARGLIRIQYDRQANCRRYPLGEAMGLRQHRERLPNGTEVARLSWHGAETCGSVWSCPECSRLIRARRARELGVLETWAGNRAYMLSLTVAHARGSNLRDMRRAMADAWRAVTRGAPWERFRRRARISGYVRALEVTHGPNGWHPHLHVIMVGGAGWPATTIGGVPAEKWIGARWREAVVARLGAEHAPSDEHGAHLTPMHDSGYLVKMGLELSLDWNKHARNGHRNPWQIAADWCMRREAADRELWIEYASGMKGARQLTWSVGLRALAGVGDETSDDEIASDEAGRTVGFIDRADWDWLSKGVGERGSPWTAHALEVGEAAGLDAMRDWIEKKRAALHVGGFALMLQERVNRGQTTRIGPRGMDRSGAGGSQARRSEEGQGHRGTRRDDAR